MEQEKIPRGGIMPRTGPDGAILPFGNHMACAAHRQGPQGAGAGRHNHSTDLQEAAGLKLRGQKAICRVPRPFFASS